MRVLLFAMLLLSGLPAQAADKDRIIGTWKLVSVMYEDQATKERTPVLGEHPRGYQIATPEGRWIAVVTADGRPVPKTDEDRAKALRSMIAYSGHSIRRCATSASAGRRNIPGALSRPAA
jgi:lipocalin-like protein